jgi:uncharacterized protein YcfL
MKKYVLLPILSFILTGCNYTISMVHTEGQANDVIDTNHDAKAKAEANVDLPEAV